MQSDRQDVFLPRQRAQRPWAHPERRRSMILPHETKEEAFAEYKNSVEALLRVARMGTGGSRVAAQVLLSAYNGDSFHVDVTVLGILDNENLAHALRVIWGRTRNPWKEPQRVIENGDALFGRLWDDWPRLHVQNRWKRSCPDCDGMGWRWTDIGSEENCRKVICRQCEGRGLVPHVQWPEEDE